MEPLLSHAFDYLSSNDGSKIRKGLRQLEGLVAQICLTRDDSAGEAAAAGVGGGGAERGVDRRRSVVKTTVYEDTPRELASLRDDPAFRAFFMLQEGFQWNVALRLIATLEKLLGRSNNGQNDLLIVSTLDLLHGILLMHPPSRSLFEREMYMNLLLDLLDPTLCPAIHSVTLLTLVTALLGHPGNTRTFEALDGLLSVTTLFKSRSAARDVRVKAVEFLYFYLMPENPSPSRAVGTCHSGSSTYSDDSVYSNSNGNGIGSSNSKSRETWTRRESFSEADGADVRSTQDKQALLGRYLGNVEDLVEDLRERAPFGFA